MANGHYVYVTLAIIIVVLWICFYCCRRYRLFNGSNQACQHQWAMTAHQHQRVMASTGGCGHVMGAGACGPPSYINTHCSAPTLGCNHPGALGSINPAYVAPMAPPRYEPPGAPGVTPHGYGVTDLALNPPSYEEAISGPSHVNQVTCNEAETGSDKQTSPAK